MISTRVVVLAAALTGCDGAAATTAGVGSVGCESSIAVSPASLVLALGDTARVSATAGCAVLPVPFAVTWRSSNTTVASVDSLAGLVRGVGTGQATVVASVVGDTIVRGASAVQVNAR